MQVLVVGATGDVGSEAAKKSLKNGHSVKALVRETSNRDKLGSAQERIAFCTGDILDRDSLGPALDGVQGVIISIRLNPTEIKKGRTYRDVELTGVVNVVEIAKEKGVEKIVFISADGVKAGCVSDMYQSKFAAEEAIRNSGIDYTIFKPSGMFKDFDFFHIPNVFKLGETDMWPFGPVEYHMSPLSHIDLAACMADALTNAKASNITLSIGGPDSFTQGEVLNMIAREAGITANYARGVSKEQLIEGVKKNPGAGFFTPEQLQDFINDSSIDHGPVKEIFGIEFMSLSEYFKQAVPRVKAMMDQQNT